MNPFATSDVSRTFLQYMLSALLLSWMAGAFADGIVLPPLVVPDIPSMPEQRALIVFHDGVEKLTVESSFDGKGNEFAWIVPAPSVPTELAKSSAGLFSALELGLQPRVIDSFSVLIFLSLFLLFWALYLLAAGRFVPVRAFFMAVVLAMTLSSGMAMLQTAGIEEQQLTGGVKTLGTARVGSFDVSTLEVDSYAALNDWLESNRFLKIDARGQAIVEEYAAAGWKFVVARLRTEGEGFCRPHPLTITFSVASPIYPMRLTQLTGSGIHLDLFVAADGTAESEGLKTVFCDEYQLEIQEYRNPAMIGLQYHNNIALPMLVDLMKEKCTLTWLTGDLTNDAMKSDCRIHIGNSVPLITTVYTSRGAVLFGVEIAFLCAGISLLPFAFWYTGRKRKLSGRLSFVVVILLLAIVGGIGALYGFLLPQATVLMPDYSSDNPISVEEIVAALNKYPEILAHMSVTDVEDYFRDALRGRNNPISGAPYTFEQTPGDITIHRDDNGIFARQYYAYGHINAIGDFMDFRITGEKKNMEQ